MWKARGKFRGSLWVPFAPDASRSAPSQPIRLHTNPAHCVLTLGDGGLGCRGDVEHRLINSVREHASDEDWLLLVKEACFKTNAHGFISKLLLEDDTRVCKRGFLLSGRQKQRITIVHAIVSDLRILMLNEATPALDKATAGRTTPLLDTLYESCSTLSVLL